MKFKIGDRVTFCGVNGVVIKDYKFAYKDALSLLVEFEAHASVPGLANQKQQITFSYDGRIFPWVIEPILKKVDR